MGLVAHWSSPYGPIYIDDLAPFPVTNIIQRAFYYMNAHPGTYYLFLGQDLRVPEFSPNLRPTGALTGVAAGINAGDVLRNSSVTLIGLDEMRTITRGGIGGVLFAVRDTASLTLGENITLSGDLNFAANAGLLLVYGRNASAYMLEGAKITNNHQAIVNAEFNAPVIVRNSTFTMNGGAITGNSSAAGTSTTGGVRISHGGIFNMNDGEISNNTMRGIGEFIGLTGAVFVHGPVTAGFTPTFNMNGGRIFGNSVTGTSATGAVSATANTLVNINDGQIFNNTVIPGHHSWTTGGLRIVGATTILNMNGGQIFNNTSYATGLFGTGGGAMHINLAIVNLNAGEIFGNAAHGLDSAGGVHLYTGARLNMRGGSIFGNTAFGDSSGGGIRTQLGAGANLGTARISGGTIYGNEAAVPAARRNIAAGSGSGAALRASTPATNNVEYGSWTWNTGTEVYDWILGGTFTSGLPADYPDGVYNNTIRVVSGVLVGL